HDIAGVGQRPAQSIEGATSAWRAAALDEVVLDIHVSGCGEQCVAGRGGEWRATEIGMEHRSGRVDHRPEGGGAGREVTEDVVHQLLGWKRPCAHTLLRRVHRVTHATATEAAL